MLTNLLTRSTHDALPALWSSRTRRVLVVIVLAVCYLLGVAYHVTVWSTATPPGPTLAFLYNLDVLLGYGILWFILSQVLRQRQATPAKIFWTTLLVGLLFIGLARVIVSVGNPPNPNLGAEMVGFEYGTGVPLTLATVLKMNVLSLLKLSFAFFLLLRLRDLVLFKRTMRSQRNWFWMLGLMGVAALFAFMKPPSTEYGVLQAVAMIPAILLMVFNSFRLSWIVFLSFKEKMIGIGLSLLLLVTLAIGLGSEDLVPGASAYIRYYSYPLYVFSDLALGFGILYCTTTFLSLLFHLPTTSDFQRKAGEVTAMHSLTNLVSQVFDSEKLFYTIAASPVEAGAAYAAWLAVADPQSGTLRPRIVSTFNITRARIDELVDTDSLYEEAYSKREPILLTEAPADHRISARPGDGLGSLLVMPLIARDELLGVLLVTKEVTHGFEKDDVESISVFAAQAALALDNARLFEEQVEKERLSRELDIAREVQRKLLPQRLPAVRGLSLAASSVSAQEVGGDYYDFIQLDEDRIAFIIADVSGKGTSAAFYMAELQGIFQSVSHLAPSPIDFLSHANRALARSLERHVFISVVYGILDLKQEEFTLARGGHCPVATIRLDGEARFIRTQGLGLGLDRGDLFRRALTEERVRLQPGDVFVLYTDGVVESRSPEGEEYGYERLLGALRTHRHEDAQDLHGALLADLNTFIEHDDYDDDMTLVVLKWHGIDRMPGTYTNNEHAEKLPPRTRPLGQEVHSE